MCPKVSLSKRESFVIPPLEEEVDSTASAVEDGGLLFSSHVFLLHDRFQNSLRTFFKKKSSRPSSRGTVFLVCFLKEISKGIKAKDVSKDQLIQEGEFCYSSSWIRGGPFSLLKTEDFDGFAAVFHLLFQETILLFFQRKQSFPPK